SPLTPQKGIILRFNVKYELQEAAINESFFALFGPQPVDDYYSHLIPPNESSKMHIVLDLHCKSKPVVDTHAIPYEVFKVKKNGGLYLSQSLRRVCLSLTSQSLQAAQQLCGRGCSLAL
ncbi:uncharacterized protein EI97DRAFT_375903, partial [Westerdykella ornata]